MEEVERVQYRAALAVTGAGNPYQIVEFFTDFSSSKKLSPKILRRTYVINCLPWPILSVKHLISSSLNSIAGLSASK